MVKINMLAGVFSVIITTVLWPSLYTHIILGICREEKVILCKRNVAKLRKMCANYDFFDLL